MRKDLYYESNGSGKIHACIWTTEAEPIAVIQIVHGIAEHVGRYDHFAKYLNQLGYIVVAEDHMGHGQSVEEGKVGYFTGGWSAAVADTYQLVKDMRKIHPGLPYVLLGHSMGSFITRTILCSHPDSGISAAIICGTAWISQGILKAGISMCRGVCHRLGEQTPSKKLQNIIFAGYNHRVEHRQTPFDWLSRDQSQVDAYIRDPLCGFVVSCGLLRDMLEGEELNQKKENLMAMRSSLPVLFIAGGDDPVGNYGAGVRRAAAEFRKAGMKHVTERIFPLCRHEILNEINFSEVYDYIAAWLKPYTQIRDLELDLDR